jgi:hypothetical protein
MIDRNYRRKFLFKEAVGADIFANAEVMTPAEFVRNYAPATNDEKEEELTERKSISLYEIIFEAPKKENQKRFPKPPQTVLSPEGDIKGSEVSPSKLADILTTRAEKGKLPSDIPYIHPGTAKSTLVSPSSLVKGKQATEPTGSDIVVVDEKNQPIDLNVLARKLTNYDQAGFTLLKQNEKMKKSSTGELEAFYNIGIPAIMGMVFDEKDNKFKIINTCPSAGSCMHVCYATKGGYVQYQAVSEKQNLTLNLLYNHPDQYVDKAVTEIVDVVKKHATPTSEFPHGIKTIIRWHDSGDFFSEDYLRLTLHIIERVKTELPSFYHDFVQFYAYTKRAKMVEPFQGKGILLRKSIGAKPEEEREIHPEKDLFSQIVPKSVKDSMIEQDVIEKTETKWIIKPGKSKILKQAIKDSPQVKFKNSYPMLTMDEYEDIEDSLKGTDKKVNVIILPGDNDRPAKDPNVAGVYLMFH